MTEHISPEEKLLRLIKGQKRPAADAAKKAPRPAAEPKPSIKNSLSFFSLGFLSFESLRKIIFAVFLASCIYLVISLVYPLVGLKQVKLPSVPSVTPEAEETEAGGLEVKPLDFYLEPVRGRQIFSNISAPEAQGQAVAVDKDLVKDLNLIGIISGENPQAIIEDKKAQKTYYLNKGQSIGEFQLEDIQEGKIILNYRGQKFELYL